MTKNVRKMTKNLPGNFKNDPKLFQIWKILLKIVKKSHTLKCIQKTDGSKNVILDEKLNFYNFQW